ncbi:MAG: 4-alpha-glucanotransferase [Eubacterium sp.]|nr:4-alpha-glucanotransferase [Eubacterium sp.]
MRESGILFPVFSLPSKFGIGSFSREAYEFVDFLEKSGQGYWQILPLGPTGFGNSPYQPVSAFAGNPYFIDPEKLIQEGMLTWDECNSRDFGHDQERVDYGAMYRNRTPLLKIAFERFAGKLEINGELKEKFEVFVEKEAYWLEDYALYMTIKDLQEGKAWFDWPEELKSRQASELKKTEKENYRSILYYYFIQYEFEQQWSNLHKYAQERKIKIIGDIPFYLSMDSVDVWAHPEAFRMDADLKPTMVAGTPPDAFSPTGQRWGNPLYDWKAMKKNGYAWWIQRLRRNYELFDVIRFDHFHGFSSYYAVPAEDETAENGTIEKGPGLDFFKTVEKVLLPEQNEKRKAAYLAEAKRTGKSVDLSLFENDGEDKKQTVSSDRKNYSEEDTDSETALAAEAGEKVSSAEGTLIDRTAPWELKHLRMIAEDLGTVTHENEKLLEDTEIPGMNVLQYAFTSWNSKYLTHRHLKNSVVYTGTHDNTTSRAWIEEIPDGSRDFVRRYINSENTDYGRFVWDFIREAYHSTADLCIIPLQDYLVKGREARINEPGTMDGNWEWRLIPNFLSDDLARSIRRLAETYSRLPE